MPSPESSGCLDEDTVLAFVAGSLNTELLGSVERHLATCRDCSWLVTAAVLVREDALPQAARAAAEAAAGTPSGAALAPGDARFERLELIAEGAMGSVYRGIDGRTGSLVAIKRLKR